MIAVITGGSSGIGRALCEALVAQGHTVITLSRRPGPVGSVHIPCELTSTASVNAAFATIAASFERVDLLINNAGSGIAGPVELTDPQAAYAQFDINLFAVLRTVRAALPLMSGGTVVNVSSVAALFSIPYQGLYSASKSALNAITLALRSELAPHGIRVCAVLPGDVRTGFTAARVTQAEAGRYGQSLARSVAVMERDEQNGMPPHKVAGAILRVAARKNPKPITIIGFSYKVLAVLEKILPIRLIRWIVDLIYRK